MRRPLTVTNRSAGPVSRCPARVTPATNRIVSNTPARLAAFMAPESTMLALAVGVPPGSRKAHERRRGGDACRAGRPWETHCVDGSVDGDHRSRRLLHSDEHGFAADVARRHPQSQVS